MPYILYVHAADELNQWLLDWQAHSFSLPWWLKDFWQAGQDPASLWFNTLLYAGSLKVDVSLWLKLTESLGLIQWTGGWPCCLLNTFTLSSGCQYPIVQYSLSFELWFWSPPIPEEISDTVAVERCPPLCLSAGCSLGLSAFWFWAGSTWFKSWNQLLGAVKHGPGWPSKQAAGVRSVQEVTFFQWYVHCHGGAYVTLFVAEEWSSPEDDQ